MELTSNQIYNSIMNGAYYVIQNKEVLNKINVFPVRDGDTGSNLSSMMQNIIRESRDEGTVKKTLKSVADAALCGARGNSGIIFAQYLNGLSKYVDDGTNISIKMYVNATIFAFRDAYGAIEEPIEGTMITVMREWGQALSKEILIRKTIKEIFKNAFLNIEEALEKTKEQLEVLKIANVVDSGAKGFTYFIEGVIYYIETGKKISNNYRVNIDYDFNDMNFEHLDHTNDIYRFCTECLLEDENIDEIKMKQFLKTKGDSVVVASNENKCRIHIHTNKPAEVFDYIYDRGAIIYQKVDDMFKQKNIIKNRKNNIALVTDSIADLPQHFIDDYQIHVINLEIFFEERVYMDKITIKPNRLLDLAKNSNNLPTFSQPSFKQIENMFNYLSTYYDSAIVMTVSKELSGTYNNFKNAANKYSLKNFKIDVINTRQNSVSQGLLVKKCAELIENKLPHNEIVERINNEISYSKILVQVKTVENMIKSGRLSVRLGNVINGVGMKPIVTLDDIGKGKLCSLAFSNNGSNKKILSHLKKLLKKSSIQSYAIVHIDNLIEAEKLKNQVKNIVGFDPDYIEETSSIIAIGAGRGAVALAYIYKEVD